jgi:hypothetical protein
MTRWHETFLGAITRRSGAAYRTLGVSEYASDAEVEQAYLRLIAQYGPDRRTGLAAPIRRQVENKARAIDNAYERIRALRKRESSRNPAPEPSHAAMATSAERRRTRQLSWVALALTGLVTITWLASLLGPGSTTSPQTRLPAPEASVGSLPASNLPASTPSASSLPATPVAPPPATAPAENPAPVERLVALTPKDPPPVRPAPPPALTGEAALVEAIRAGQIRPANGSDLSRWTLRWSEANRRGVPAGFQERSASMNTYVIQKDFTIPAGLNGAHSVIFLLDTRVPYPRGSPGHSVVLDLSTGGCMGVTCRMLLD